MAAQVWDVNAIADRAASNHRSLRDVAHELQLDRIRVYRLGWAFHLAPSDPSIPPAVLATAREQTESEDRYHCILTWLRLRGQAGH